MKYPAIVLASLSLLIAGCGESREEQERTQIRENQRLEEIQEEVAAAEEPAGPALDEQYRQLVTCAATHFNLSNIYNSIAGAIEDPARANAARANGAASMRQSRAMADTAIDMAQDASIGRSRDQVLSDIEAAHQDVRALRNEHQNFDDYARSQARAADSCTQIVASL